MSSYRLRVSYYETDQMSIAHHSNYIRWMEDARLHVMREGSISHRELEAEGIQIPVTSVSCEYLKSARFDDIVCIDVSPVRYNGVRMVLEYRICREDTGELLAVGQTGHCFIDAQTGRPLSLKHRSPAFHERFSTLFSKKSKDG